jgi:hypothetical protein
MPNPLTNLRGRALFKQRWADQWVGFTGVIPLRCLRACAPIGQTADFNYEFGDIKRETATTFTVEPPKDLRDWYTKIELWDPLDSSVARKHWHGIVPKTTTLRRGGITVDSGSQQFQGVGLEHLLDRQFIADSYAIQDTKLIRVEHIPNFNVRYKKGLKVKGNRSKSVGPDGVYVFSEAADAGVWNNRQIVDYLLQYWSPDGPAWTVSGQVEALEGIEEVHSVPRGESKSLLDWLHILIDRRRGVSFVIEPALDGASFMIRVFTIVESAISVGTRTIPPNPLQIPFGLPGTFPGWHLVDPIQFIKTTLNIFDILEVRGERMLAATTVSYFDSKIILGSTQVQRDNYVAAEEEARLADRFDGVWNRFKLNPNWTYDISSILGVAANDSCRLDCDDNGVVTTGTADAWHDATLLERTIPFKKGWDYTKSPAVNENDDKDHPEFLPIQVFAKLPDDVEQAGKYRLAEKFAEGETGIASCNVRALDTQAGFQLHCTPHHLFAKGDWPKDPNGAFQNVEHEPRMDYRDLAATIAFRTDRRLRVRGRIPAGVAHETERVRYIDCPGAEYWYATRGTVVDVEGGILKRINEGGRVLRNDIDVLQGILAFGQAWYALERQSVGILIKQIDNWVDLGSLLTSIQGQYNEDVNTIVSSVETDFATGTIKYMTGWGDFDVMGAMVEDRKGLASRRANEFEYLSD